MLSQLNKDLFQRKVVPVRQVVPFEHSLSQYSSPSKPSTMKSGANSMMVTPEKTFVPTSVNRALNYPQISPYSN